MFCEHCRQVVYNSIKELPQVEDVSVSGNVARVCVQDKSVLTSIEDAITKAGYITKVQWMKKNINIWKYMQIIQLLAVAGIFLGVRCFLKIFGFIRSAFEKRRSMIQQTLSVVVIILALSMANRLVCQNCGNVFTVDDVGVSSFGCNPMNIEYEEDDDSIIVATDVLDSYQSAFARWQGPVNDSK
jgi:copper chaperone CopZ